MKVFIASFIIFFIIITLSVCYSDKIENTINQIDNMVNHIETCVKEKNWLESLKKVEELIEKWNKTEKKCKVFIDHKELDEITKTMQEAKQYIIFQDAENAMLKISLLHILLEQIPQNESITLENIL